VTALALVTANRFNVVESFIQMTLPTDEAVTAGQLVKINTTTGKFTKANGTTSGEARVWGIATKTVAAGMPVTAVRKGVATGYNIDALAYDAPVYLSDTDGMPDTAAGTVSVVIGRVIPATGVTLGTAYDKLLQIDL